MASLEFDNEENAMYLRLRKGKVSSTEPLADNIFADLDEKKKVLGLEFLLPPTLKKEIKTQLRSPARRPSKRSR
ncbi:MAG: DUF2283 domain-containing protein [Nitrososphaerota archaeon]|nr:DUF2283 domain-containing protein [Nitrososphaerota archaeon]